MPRRGTTSKLGYRQAPNLDKHVYLVWNFSGVDAYGNPSDNVRERYVRKDPMDFTSEPIVFKAEIRKADAPSPASPVEGLIAKAKAYITMELKQFDHIRRIYNVVGWPEKIVLAVDSNEAAEIWRREGNADTRQSDHSNYVCFECEAYQENDPAALEEL